VRKFLQALSPIDEFVIVVIAAFGPLIVYNIEFVLQGTPPNHHIRDGEIIRLLINEAILLLTLGCFLYARGWTLERIGLGPNLKETMFGIGFFVVAELLAQTACFAAVLFVPGLEKAEAEFAAAKGSLSPVLVIALSVVNPIFEEGFLCGYMITALRGRTHWSTAVAASVAIRTVYHFYQGPLGVISILPFGIVLTFCYLRWGRRWPLIVAHVAGDYIPLILYSQG
jgi:membrane protease YdiL (CAAX protease family)